MFNLGLPEVLLILAAALLVFGPKRLPELAKSMGKGIRDFKKALNGEEEKNQNQNQITGEKNTIDNSQNTTQNRSNDGHNR